MKSHIRKDDAGYFCGETALTALAEECCGRCQRGVDKLLALLKEAAKDMQLDINFAGGEAEVKQNPTLKRRQKLVDRINKALGLGTET